MTGYITYQQFITAIEEQIFLKYGKKISRKRAGRIAQKCMHYVSTSGKEAIIEKIYKHKEKAEV